MKKGKADGPDDIPVEIQKRQGVITVRFLTLLFNGIFENEKTYHTSHSHNFH